jgi:hypothetical protein
MVLILFCKHLNFSLEALVGCSQLKKGVRVLAYVRCVLPFFLIELI